MQKPLSTGLLRLGVLLAMVAAVFSSATVRAADDAKTRALLYEAEARKILKKDRWAIIREGSGSFTAVHRALANGESKQAADVPPLMVHVSIAFDPHSADRTDCAVKIEAFQIVPRTDGKKPRVVGPFKADYPENTKYIQAVLTKAEDELGKKHPRYQAK